MMGTSADGKWNNLIIHFLLSQTLRRILPKWSKMSIGVVEIVRWSKFSTMEANTGVKAHCCCLQTKPFFLPKDISSSPSVLPDSSS